YFSVRSQANQEMATTLRLARDNHRLLQEQQLLHDPTAIQRDARALGMIRQGERPYVITGAAAR
ncbi:MAG: septum formation initiator family protein, partial [Solirubrobacteraceae bacterium]